VNVYVCTDHDGRWPVGVASVVVAGDENEARRLLDAKLTEIHLKPSNVCPYTLQQISTEGPAALVLLEGDY
jgi:hypothetical protein